MRIFPVLLATTLLHADTPALMREAASGSLDRMKALIEDGAKVNEAAADGATALHWAVQDLAKIKLLLAKGADPNARTRNGRTPLLIAARSGAFGAVEALLAAGADPELTETGSNVTPLSEAVQRADVDAIAALLAKKPSPVFLERALGVAAATECLGCARILIAAGAKPSKTSNVMRSAAQRGNAEMVRRLAGMGANPNVTDSRGDTPLLRAAHRDTSSAAVVRALLAAGADPKHVNKEGETALSVALRRGDTEIVKALRQAGAPEGKPEPAVPKPREQSLDPAGAIAKSLPLLQGCGEAVIKLRGCVSCHNNSLPVAAAAAARKRGLKIDEAAQAKAIKMNAGVARGRVSNMMLGTGVPGAEDTAAYILWSLAEAGHPADAMTDASVHYLAGRQRHDGSWHTTAHRPPQEYSDLAVTALSLRSIDAYAPAGRRKDIDAKIAKAVDWFMVTPAEFTEDKAMRLAGLAWGRAPQETVSAARRELLATQSADGGWRQVPGIASDAYGTGLALYALSQSGLAAGDPAYAKGVSFLLKQQLDDGSWYVRTRALPFQPFFESGFPHGHDQWISAAATSWAVLALAAVR
ncbi:MAG: hypothetical protein FJW39_05995 [Acidobacteria bacterium]|nr:hypothetical protein [Acidobacteriota bacterium]